MEKVSMIGLGDLGGAIAQRLLECGIELTVFDVSEDLMAKFVELGAYAAPSLEAISNDARYAITCLPNVAAVESVVLGEGGLKQMAAGGLVVDISTSSRNLTLRIAEELSRREISFCDSPLGRGPWAALKGEATLMVGGSVADLERARPVLSCIADRIYHCGPVGSGQALKLANNLASCANLCVAVEAIALAVRAGLDPKVAAEAMVQTAANSWHLENTVSTKVLERHDLSPIFKLLHAAKDMTLVTEMAADLGLKLPTTEGALRLYGAGIEQGLAGRDQSAIIKVLLPDFESWEDV